MSLVSLIQSHEQKDQTGNCDFRKLSLPRSATSLLTFRCFASSVNTFKDFKRFEVLGSKLWFTFKSGRSKTAYGYKFSVQAKYAEEDKRANLSQADSQRSVIVQSSTKVGQRTIHFLDDVLKDLKAYPEPSDPKDNHLHETIRLYAALIMANLTMTEVYGVDGSAMQNLETNDPFQYNIKAILKRQLSFKYFFPPERTSNPLILRLCALCISELLELESNRNFTDTRELQEVIEVVTSLANETDASCAYYGMKALCLLAVEKNYDVLLSCGALTTFYEGSRRIKDPNVLKYVWQGFNSMSAYLDKALAYEGSEVAATVTAPSSSFNITTERMDGNDFIHIRYSCPIPASGKVYFELETVHGGNLFLGFAPDNWEPTKLRPVGYQTGSVSFNGLRRVGITEGVEKDFSFTTSGGETRSWEAGTIVGVAIDKENRVFELSYDGKPVGVSLSFPSETVDNWLFVISMYKSEGLALNFGQENFHNQELVSPFVRLVEPTVVSPHALQYWDKNSWVGISNDSPLMLTPSERGDSARPLQRAKALLYLSAVIPSNDSFFHEPFVIKSSSFPFEECIVRLGVSRITISGLKINFSTITDRKEKLLVYSDPLCTQLVREFTNSDKYFAKEENDLVIFSDCVYFKFFADNYFIDNILQPSFEALVRPDYSKEIDSSLMGTSDDVVEEGKEILAMFESEHNYADNMHVIYPVVVAQTVDVVEISFDAQTYTENSYDYLQFFSDDKCEVPISPKYSGDKFPGKDNNPPLRIAANHFWFLFHSDGGANYWGYKFYVRKDSLTSVRKAKEDDFQAITKKDLLTDKVVETSVQEGGHTSIAFDETFSFSFYDTLQVFLQNPSSPDAPVDLKPDTIICSKATAAYLRAKLPNLIDESGNIVEYSNEGVNIPHHHLYLKWVVIEPERTVVECLRNSHPMEIKKVSNSWHCDICSISYSSDTKRRNCLTCDYDVCFSCIPRTFKANRGKGLEAKVCLYRNFDPLGALRNNSSGMSLKFATIHPYVDNMNEENVIDLTKLKDPPPPEGEVAHPLPTCWRGHTMEVTESRYWSCDVCRESEGRHHNCRWHCEDCDYDVCFPCRDPRDDPTPPPCKDTSHVMKKTVGGSWNCDLCHEGRGRCRRWRCASCDYDTCFICIPERPEERARSRELCIVFDPRSCTEESCDYMQISAVTQNSGSYDNLLRYGRERFTGQFSSGYMPSLEKPLFFYHPPVLPTDSGDCIDRDGTVVKSQELDRSTLFYRFYSDGSRVGECSSTH